jgi:hypothetical protein
MTEKASVWGFVGEGARFPSGIFASIDDAEAWIRQHQLSGLLTQYPVGEGVFDWAVATGRFKPRPDKAITASFIGAFSTAFAEHHHYEDGLRKY